MVVLPVVRVCAARGARVRIARWLGMLLIGGASPMESPVTLANIQALRTAGAGTLRPLVGRYIVCADA